jgi:hypothetical protein
MKQNNQERMSLGCIQQPRIILILLILMLKIVYDLSYIYLVSYYFSWTPAFYPLSMNITKIVESYILTVVMALTLPCRTKQPSHFVMLFLGTVVILPMLTLYGLADRERAYIYMTILTYFVILATTIVFPRVKIGVFGHGFKFAMIVSGALVIVVIFLLVQKVGLEHFDLRFWNYPQMVQNRWLVQSKLEENTYLAYLYFWMFIVFLPTLMIGSLAKGRYASFTILLLIQIILTGLTARRHTLAVIPVLLGTYMIAEKERLAPMLMVLGFAGIVTITTLISLIIPDLRVVGTWMERFFFVPPRVNYAYYEFFSVAGHVYLSSTKLPSPIAYPFEMTPEMMVSYYIFLNPESVASCGFIGTSYMHMGFPGMVIFGMIVGILLRLADSLTVRRMPLKVGASLSMVMFDGLLRGADLTTWLLTFGGLAGITVLFLLGSRIQKGSIPTAVFPR